MLSVTGWDSWGKVQNKLDFLGLNLSLKFNLYWSLPSTGWSVWEQYYWPGTVFSETGDWTELCMSAWCSSGPSHSSLPPPPPPSPSWSSLSVSSFYITRVRSIQTPGPYLSRLPSWLFRRIECLTSDFGISVLETFCFGNVWEWTFWKCSPSSQLRFSLVLFYKYTYNKFSFKYTDCKM